MKSSTNGNRRGIITSFLLLCTLNCVYSRQVLTVKLSPVDSNNQNSVKVIGTVPESSFHPNPAITTTGVMELNPVQDQAQVKRPVQVVQQTLQQPVRQEDTQQGVKNQQTPVPGNVASLQTVVTTLTVSKDEKSKGKEEASTEKPEDGKPDNEKPETEKAENEEPENKNPEKDEKPAAENSKNEKPETEKTENEKQENSEKPAAENSKTEKTENEKAENEKQENSEKPAAENSKTEKTETEKAENEKQENSEKPAAENSKNEKPETEKPENEKSSEETTTTQEEATNAKVETIMSKVSGRKICQSPHCFRVAKIIKDALNTSADPCDNFYEYACGNWIKEHKIPKFHSQYSRISELSENNEHTLLHALKTDQAADNDNLRKIKLFFRSCMDVKTIDKEGNGPLNDYIKGLGSWSLDKKWESKRWDFYRTLQTMHHGYPAEVFFTVDVHTDPTKQHNSADYIVLIDQATLNLPQIVYFTSPKIVRMVRNYMTDIIHLAGINKKIAKKRVKEIIKFEAKLATISIPKIAKKYVRIPLEKLAKAIPEFPWVDHLKGIFWPRPVGPDTKVIVLANDYLPNLFDLLRKTDKRVLSNYMVWRLVKDVVPLLSKDFREKHLEFKKKLLGVRHDKPREKKCFGYTNNLLGPLMGALFIKNAFSPESKHKVESMMEGIIKAFKNNIENVDWVDKQTVAAVEEKADEAVYKVGYPEYLWDDKKFNERYDELNITEGSWFNNVLETDKFASLQTYQKLNTVCDKHQWITVPHLVNAFYVITKNEIVVPAGILQPPFFYPEEIPRSLSYGAIGHVLGHELTHGFDTTGRKFDKDGEEIDFQHSREHGLKTWSKSSIKMFEKRAKCLVDQFSKFKVLGKFHIDGFKTLGENIADGGGVKLAYHAYRDFLEKHSDEEILPILDMPHEKLFFLGYAQKECVRTTDAAEFLAVMEDVHPLSKYRVIGTLSNMEEFSKVYKCKKGDKMNPEKKCEVW